VASQEERNARLDTLAASVNDWADRRKRELETRVESAKAILNGRGGADRLANSTSQAASALVVQEVDDFLLGS
jgi:hypothetical protein